MQASPNATAVQAYNGETASKAEQATAALAAPAPSEGAANATAPSVKTIAKKPGFDLFKPVKANERNTSRKTLASARAPRPRRDVGSKRRVAMATLPGVRRDGSLVSVAPVKRAAKRGVKALSAPVRVASAAALARIGKHGLRTQHSKVSIGCLKPRLVTLIKKAERHFGRHAVVTSGYRSPRHNRRIGGARNSMHVSCRAADIQIKGVSKWKLAAWLRTQEGRGGVGTYCHTQSVHLDTGKTRDWNWRCKRRKSKRRRT